MSEDKVKRFFEAIDRSREIGIQGAGPINTNCHANVKSIKLVIICESPSEDEVEKGFPTVSSTGAKIFNHLVREKMINSTNKFSFEQSYNEFENNGIYINNLVRYQADLNIKGSRKEKDNKVREIWQSTNEDLFAELKEIASKFQNTKVLLAIGASFFPQLKQVTNLLNELGLGWFVTSHPSRSENIFSNHYNPQCWNSDGIFKTKLMKNIELYQKRTQLKKGST